MPANRQRRVEHWRAVAIAACEQCGRNRVPEIEPIGDFAEACAASGAELRLMLLPQAPDSLAAAGGRGCVARCCWSAPKEG